MNLRKFYCFDEMPVGAFGAYSGWAAGIVGGGTIVSVNDQKWLTATTAAGSLYIVITQQGAALVGKTVIGCRVWFDNLTVPYCGGMYGSAALQKVSPSQLGIAINTVAYVEVVLDWVNFTQSFYVNGNPTAAFSIQFTSAQMATIKTNYINCVFGGGGAGGNWRARDFHVREYDIGEAYVPMKSPRIAPVYMKNTAAPAYTPSDGSNADSVLNTPLLDYGASLSAPTLDTVGGAGTSSPIKSDLILGNVFQGSILGLDILDTAKSSESPAGSYTAVLTQNSVSFTGSFALAAAMSYRKSLFNCMPKAPDGTEWSRTKINTTKLTLSAISG